MTLATMIASSLPTVGYEETSEGSRPIEIAATPRKRTNGHLKEHEFFAKLDRAIEEHGLAVLEPVTRDDVPPVHALDAAIAYAMLAPKMRIDTAKTRKRLAG